MLNFNALETKLLTRISALELQGINGSERCSLPDIDKVPHTDATCLRNTRFQEALPAAQAFEDFDDQCATTAGAAAGFYIGEVDAAVQASAATCDASVQVEPSATREPAAAACFWQTCDKMD